MKKLILSLTLLSTIGSLPVNAEEELSSERASEIFHKSAKVSADEYCSEKDNGTPEEKALREAYYEFVANVANGVDTTPIVVHENLNEKQKNSFWEIFNTFAVESCPEYY